MSPDEVIKRYLGQLDSLLAALDPQVVAEVIERLRQVRDARRTIFLAGNGGSAATAAHLANDFSKATRASGRTPIRALCLSDNGPWFSALANDEGYDRVFAGQLENLAEEGDVLVVISASGNSPNLLSAVDCARERGVTTIGLLGFDGGRLRTMVDLLLWTESPLGLYGPVESAHSVIGDILTTCLIEDRPEPGVAGG